MIIRHKSPVVSGTSPVVIATSDLQLKPLQFYKGKQNNEEQSNGGLLPKGNPRHIVYKYVMDYSVNRVLFLRQIKNDTQFETAFEG
jgi:hypothetical protein